MTGDTHWTLWGEYAEIEDRVWTIYRYDFLPNGQFFCWLEAR